MMAGHGCLGCSEPNFWDRLNTGNKKGFYVPLARGSYHT
jgi:hydrogenase small subunit